MSAPWRRSPLSALWPLAPCHEEQQLHFDARVLQAGDTCAELGGDPAGVRGGLDRPEEGEGLQEESVGEARSARERRMVRMKVVPVEPTMRRVVGKRADLV